MVLLSTSVFSVTSSLIFDFLRVSVFVFAALAGVQSDHRSFHPGSCSGWTQRKPGDDPGSSPLHCSELCCVLEDPTLNVNVPCMVNQKHTLIPLLHCEAV